MTDVPLVTTIVPAYNHERYVEEAVRSVWAQDYPNHELVAIDDGSSDATPDMLRRLEAESPIPMRVIAKENEGVSKTLNLGIRESNGDYVNVCASDDRMTPNKIRVLVDALEAAGPDVGIAFGDRQYIDEEGAPTGAVRTTFRPTGDRVFLDMLMGRVVIPAVGTVYRRRVFDEIGGFREDVALEDYEMFLRIGDRFRVVYVPEVVVEYRMHPTQTRRELLERLMREKIEIFEGWVGKAPELDDPDTLREARVRLYTRTGQTLYGNRSLTAARRILLRSLVHKPLQPAVWRLLPRTLVGERLLRVASSVKSSVGR